MRIVAFAFAVLSLGAPLAPAAAQNFGPGPGPYSDDPRSGPPRGYNERPYQQNEPVPYFTERAPQRRPGEGFQSPPYRGAPPVHEERYEQGGDDRPGMRPQPYPQDHEPPSAVRRVEKSPPPMPPDAGGARGPRTTVWPPVRQGEAAPPPQRPAERHVPRPAERTTVSIAEFRELENRVRELERMLERRDFRDDRRSGPVERPPTVIYR